MYNLIFEGIDRVGKSTIIKELQKRFACAYHKIYGGDSHAYIFKNQSILFNSLTSLSGYQYIFDRGHISELVYGKILRPETQENGVIEKWIWMKDEQIQRVHEQGIIKNKPIIVYIEPFDISKDLCDNKTIERRAYEIELYREYIKKTKMKIIYLETMGFRNTFFPLDSIIIDLLGRVS